MSQTVWTLVYTKDARKDAAGLVQSNLRSRAETLLRLIEKDPYQQPPPGEKLVDDLKGAFSRRINIQHRLVYQVRQDFAHVDPLRVARILARRFHY